MSNVVPRPSKRCRWGPPTAVASEAAPPSSTAVAPNVAPPSSRWGNAPQGSSVAVPGADDYSVASALALDHERLQKAALKNLQYLEKLHAAAPAPGTEAGRKSSSSSSSSSSGGGGGGSSSGVGGGDSRSMPQKPRAKRLKHAMTSSTPTVNSSVYCEGLPAELTDVKEAQALLTQFAQRFGVVRRIKMYRFPDGQLKRSALVTFTTEASALSAVRAAPWECDSFQLHVSRAVFNDREQQQEGGGDQSAELVAGGSSADVGGAPSCAVLLCGMFDAGPLSPSLARPCVLCEPKAITALQVIEANVQIELARARAGKAAIMSLLCDGSVLLVYAARSAAANCAQAMHGRRVEGRQIMAHFIRDNSTTTDEFPCCGVLLKNAYDIAAVSQQPRQQAQATMRQLTADARTMANTFGSVCSLSVIFDGSVEIIFASNVSAYECVKSMDKSQFGGRHISASFNPSSSGNFMPQLHVLQEQRFEVKEGIVDDEDKLEAFLLAM